MAITIDKAIEILASDKFGSRWPSPKSEVDAIRLGVEALKEIQRNRPSFRTNIHLLPGETKE